MPFIILVLGFSPVKQSPWITEFAFLAQCRSLGSVILEHSSSVSSNTSHILFAIDRSFNGLIEVNWPVFVIKACFCWVSIVLCGAVVAWPAWICSFQWKCLGLWNPICTINTHIEILMKGVISMKVACSWIVQLKIIESNSSFSYTSLVLPWMSGLGWHNWVEDPDPEFCIFIQLVNTQSPK